MHARYMSTCGAGSELPGVASPSPWLVRYFDRLGSVVAAAIVDGTHCDAIEVALARTGAKHVGICDATGNVSVYLDDVDCDHVATVSPLPALLVPPVADGTFGILATVSTSADDARTVRRELAGVRFEDARARAIAVAGIVAVQVAADLGGITVQVVDSANALRFAIALPVRPSIGGAL